MPGPSLSPEKVAEVRRVFAETRNKVETAHRCGVSPNSVTKYVVRQPGEGGQEIRPEFPVRSQEEPVAPRPDALVDGRPMAEYFAAFVEWARQNGHAARGQMPEMPGEPVVELPAQEELLVRAEKPYRRVAFLSDLHFPYVDAPALTAALAYLKDWKPDLFICGGDWFDCYMISDYERDPTRFRTLQDEFDSARPYLAEIDALGSDVIFLEGNHEHRLQRLIGRNAGLSGLRSLEFARAANLPARWKWYRSQTHYKLGGLLFLHGDLRGRGGGARHIAANLLGKLRTSCMFGHYHRFGAHWESDYHMTPRAAFANGHLSHVPSQDFCRVPDWSCGFSTVEFDHAADVFGVRQHLIVDGKFVADGKLYKG